MTYDVERVLADIDADHGDRCIEFLRHGVLLVLSAPCQLLILAGPEHGRTIPLAVLSCLPRIARKMGPEHLQHVIPDRITCSGSRPSGNLIISDAASRTYRTPSVPIRD